MEIISKLAKIPCEDFIRVKDSSNLVISTDANILKIELVKLKQEQMSQHLRADANYEMINVAEEQFDINFRKKLAPNSD